MAVVRGQRAAGAAIDIWKRKRWYQVIAPKIFQEVSLGETPALEAVQLKGRTVQANLGMLLRDMKRQHIDVTFEVDQVTDNHALTHVRALEISSSSIKRLVRRGRNRIDDSFGCLTADNKSLRIKPLLITAFAAPHSVQTRLRKTVKAHLLGHVRTLAYDALLQNIITFQLQQELKKMLDKIYPVRSCEIRVLELLPDGAVKPESLPAPAVQEVAKVREQAKQRAEEKAAGEKSGEEGIAQPAPTAEVQAVA